MASFYEVPVTLEIEEESMCVYIKIYAGNSEEAAIKAVELVTSDVDIYSDESDIVKI